MHLYIQNWFSVGLFAFFHLKMELNNDFSFDFFLVLQITLVNRALYTLAVQILE
jgi:hypothetical protein